MTHIELNGVRYHVERSGSGRPLFLLHGFTGSAQSWSARLPALHAAGYETIAVDLLGHGESDSRADPARYRAERAVEDLITLIDHLGFDSAIWLGYSMGARLALNLAVTNPAHVRALILESGSPAVAGVEERAARVASDEMLATKLERDGIEPFVDFWQSLPMFASHQRLSDEARDRLRRQRLSNNPAGLAGSLRGFGQGVQPYLGDRVSGLAMPVCLIAGEDDEKYRRLALEMQAQPTDAEATIVASCGHTPHLEQPNEFDRIVTSFLDRIERESTS
jgi:2-succinyl-6-hydroxy-2,4-cyclohexadiene-1-carboxylate synthase